MWADWSVGGLVGQWDGTKAVKRVVRWVDVWVDELVVVTADHLAALELK